MSIHSNFINFSRSSPSSSSPVSHFNHFLSRGADPWSTFESRWKNDLVFQIIIICCPISNRFSSSRFLFRHIQQEQSPRSCCFVCFRYFVCVWETIFEDPFILQLFHPICVQFPLIPQLSPIHFCSFSLECSIQYLLYLLCRSSPSTYYSLLYELVEQS